MTFLSLSRPIPLNLFKTFRDPHILHVLSEYFIDILFIYFFVESGGFL